MFGEALKIILIGPSSRRRAWVISAMGSSGSSSAESGAAVYNAHPYFSNRSPAWVRIWSRGIGPNTATLRVAPVRASVVIEASGHVISAPTPVHLLVMNVVAVPV